MNESLLVFAMVMGTCVTVLVLVVALCAAAHGYPSCEGTANPGVAVQPRIHTIDPVFSTIVATDAEFELIGEGFGLAEGVVGAETGWPHSDIDIAIGHPLL